ncbi:MAG: diguanylate cyclase [Burkholderiales bacterium]
MQQDPASKNSWRAYGTVAVILVAVCVALVSGGQAIYAERESRNRLTHALDLTRQVLELRYLAADLNSTQIAYALDIWRSSPAASKDDHPARNAFLAAAAAYRSKLNAIDSTRLTGDEQRQYLAAQRAYEQFMRLQDRNTAAYRGGAGPATQAPATTEFAPSLELVGDLVERVTSRSDQTAVQAARASDRAGAWKIGFAFATALLAGLFGVMNVRAIMHRVRMIGNLDALSRTDQLTGVANRRRFDEECPLALERARRTERHLSVAMLDLDNFKSFNDTNGHMAGDRLLAATAGSFASRLREGDIIARYGGEEFAIILHGCSADAAREIVDRVREVLPDSQTFSAGITESDGHEEVAMMVARAGQALDAAKHAGRNRTVIMRRDATVELHRDTDLPFVVVRRG